MKFTWDVVVPFALLIPMGYLFVLIRTALAQLVTLRTTVYTKQETDKMIDLRLTPFAVQLADIKEDVSYIRRRMESSDGG